MKKHYLLTALAVALMASCQNEDGMLDSLNRISKMEVIASLEETPDSRTALQDDGKGGYKVIWSKGDAFSVFYGSADAHNKFVLATGDGQTSATFESEGSFKIGSDTESGSGSFAIVGYYPYSSTTTVSQSNGSYVVNAEIPVNQTYAEGSFGQNASPMVAVSDNLKFSFKNVASALRVPLKGDKTITKATLTSTSKIAGAATVTVSETDEVWLPSVDVANGSSMVVLSCGDGVELNSSTATDFIFVLAPGTYAAGMVVKFYASDGTYYSYTTQGEQTFTRSKVTYLDDKTYGATGTGHATGTAGVEEANNELANGVEDVTVTIASTDSEPTVELPATTSENPTNLTFTSIPDNTTVTIEASTESNNGEAKEVNVSVPASDNGYNFNINLPNSTVTLAASGETATYNEVTAATAENTLIIAAGVTVAKLYAKKGHVRVQGKLSAIELADEHGYGENVTYIIKEEGAEIPSGLGENFKVVSSAEWDLRKAIETGGNLTLSEDITVVGNRMILPTGKTMILDLNGKTITWNTSDSYGIQNEGNLTIKNGTINFTGGHPAGAAVRNKAVINMNNVSITANAKCFFNNGTGDAPLAQLGTDPTIVATITGGTFESTPGHYSEGYHIYAIETEFYSKMTLSDAEVEGDGGVCVDVSYATLSNVTATHTCTTGAHDLYVAAGNATVSDCTFSNMAAYSDDTYGKAVVNGTIYENGTTGIGNIADKDALTSAFTKGGSYILTTDVTVDSKLSLESGNMILDLGGKTLKIEGESISYGLINKGNMTIKNGTIEFAGDGSNGAAVCNMSEINLDNVNVTSNSVCFRNWGDANVKNLDGKTVDDAAVTAVINGGTFTSTFCKTESHDQHRYAIHGYYLSNMTMTGSTVSGSGGIHVDVSFATLTNVKATANCKYGAHDLYVAAGNATVSNCTFANPAAYSDATYGNAVVNGQTYQHDTNNSNGTTVAINLGSN